MELLLYYVLVEIVNSKKFAVCTVLFKNKGFAIFIKFKSILLFLTARVFYKNRALYFYALI